MAVQDGCGPHCGIDRGHEGHCDKCHRFEGDPGAEGAHGEPAAAPWVGLPVHREDKPGLPVAHMLWGLRFPGRERL
jgi:hypothetical protein